jgi:hypothetical protein
MRNIINDDAINNIGIGNAAPMPRKKGVGPSADRRRSCTDDRDDNGNPVGRQED